MRPIQEKLRSHLCRAQKGWFVERPIVGCLTNHPRRAESSVALHGLFGAATPPWPRRGVRFPLPASYSCVFRSTGFVGN